MPEEPPQLGFAPVVVETAPAGLESDDKEGAVADDFMLQAIASPQKALIVPGPREAVDAGAVPADEQVLLPRPPPPPSSPPPPASAAMVGARVASQVSDAPRPSPQLSAPDLRGSADTQEVPPPELPPPSCPPMEISEPPLMPGLTASRAVPLPPPGSPPAMCQDVIQGQCVEALVPISNSSFFPALVRPDVPTIVDVMAPINDSTMPPPTEGILCKNSRSDMKRLPLKEDSQENRVSREGALSRIGWTCVVKYSGKIVRHPCKFICLYLVLVIALVAICWRPFVLDTDFESFIRADGHAMRQREAYLLAYGEKKGLSDSRRLKETSRELDSAQSSSPFAEEEWWKAMRNFDDHHTSLEDEEMDEGNGEIRLDEDRLEESEEEPLFFDTDSRERERRLAGAVFYIRKSFTVIYYSVKKNALDDRVLRDIRDLEWDMRHLAGWKKYCDGDKYVSKVSKRLCDPGESIAAYAWPTQEKSTDAYQQFVLKFDGEGSNVLAQPAVLSYLQTSGKENHDLRRFFPKTFTAPSMVGNATYPAPEAIRTVFTFKIIVGQSGDSMAKVKIEMGKLKEQFKTFIQEDVYDVLSGASFANTKVYYYGDSLTSYEITKTLMNDCKYAGFSVLFVLVYLFIHTHSLLISCSCLGIIFSSLPVAYVLTPASKTTIASFLSLFLITGVGSDVVFVFTDFWDQSARVYAKHDERVAWMMLHAGKSCFATSLTTSVSFFANLASVLQPLREFGLFMGLCVMSAFVLVLLFLPPLLMINERCSGGSGQKGTLPFLGAPVTVHPATDEEAPDGPHLGDAQKLHQFQKGQPGKPVEELPPVSGIRRVLLFIFGFVANRPGKILVATGVLVIIFFIGCGSNAKLAQGVPKIFPEEHNQVQAEEWQGKFHTVALPKYPALGKAGAACNVNVSASQSLDVPCAFHWCEVDNSTILGADDGSSGYCWRSEAEVISVSGKGSGNAKHRKLKDPWSSEECVTIHVRSRLSGPMMPRGFDWVSTWKPVVERITNSTVASSAVQVEWLERVALENWETGKVTMSNFWDVGVTTGRPRNWNQSGTEALTKYCQIQTLCFFGTQKCSLPGWRPLGRSVLSQPLLKPPRRLNEEHKHEPPDGRYTHDRRLVLKDQPGRYRGPLIAVNKRVDVTVVFGLKAAASTPLVGAPDEQWGFDGTFEPENPWAQRAILSACVNVPAELLVIKTNCWVDIFRTWLNRRGERFPTRNFDSSVVTWFGPGTGVIVAPSNLWMKKKRVKASKIAFAVNFRSDASAAQGVEYMKLWEKYMEGINEVASVTANRAWFTAALFVRAEAELAIIGSTQATIAISALCGFIGMCVFTMDPFVSLLVTSLVLGIISGLAFFIVVVMGWAIGPIEVISLVVFVGYAVTYSLHIAHNYVEVNSQDHEAIFLEQEYLTKERRIKERADRAALARALSWRDTQLIFRVDPVDDQDAKLSSTVAVPEAKPFRPVTAEDVCGNLTALRRARTRMAVLHVGGATMSSAVSTMGSSMFLLFCTMNIFVKLGSVVIAVTFLSIVFALVPLPALLLKVGPSEEPIWIRYARCCGCARRPVPGGTFQDTTTVPDDTTTHPDDVPTVRGQVIEEPNGHSNRNTCMDPELLVQGKKKSASVFSIMRECMD